MARNWPFQRAEALPTYAFLVTDEIKARVREAGHEIIDLGLGNPDRATPKPIVERLHAEADVGKNHRYHPGRGLFELRRALMRWYERRYNVHFDVEREVIVTMGAKEGISHLALAMLDQEGLGDAAEGWGGDWYVAWDNPDGTSCIRADFAGVDGDANAELADALSEWAASAGDAIVEEVPDGLVRLTSCTTSAVGGGGLS